MEKHVRTLGILSIIYATVGALGAIAVFLASGGIRELFASFDDPMTGIIVITVACLHAVTALPAFIGGVFVLRYHGWARAVLIITSSLETLTVPVGTIIGLYGLWVLLTPEVEPLFTDGPPPPMPRRSRPPGTRIMRADRSRAELGRVSGD